MGKVPVFGWGIGNYPVKIMGLRVTVLGLLCSGFISVAAQHVPCTRTGSQLTCYICKGGTSVLSGKNIVWKPNAQCSSDGSWKLSKGAKIEGPGEISGKVFVVGSDSSIADIEMTSSIDIIGEDCKNVNIKNITITGPGELVGVRAYRSKSDGKLIDIDNLSIESVRHKLAVPRFATAAFAHVADSTANVLCEDASSLVVVQPVAPLTKLTTAGCAVTDLGRMLNVFGRAYEVSFFNPTYSTPKHGWYQALGILLAMDIGLVVIIATCHSKSLGAARKKGELSKKTD